MSQNLQLPIGRTKNFPEGSIAQKYVEHQRLKNRGGIHPQTFPKNRTIRGITHNDAPEQLTFIKQVQALLSKSDSKDLS